MSGYYSIAQADGRWMFKDGAGKPFYSLGVNCFNYGLGLPMEEKLMAKYGGSGWYERWAAEKLEEVWGLGFNTLAAWHDNYFVKKPVPKTIEIRCSAKSKMVNKGWGGYGFPDVFDASFIASTHSAMVEAFYNKGVELAEDSSLIGLYTDNELHWWGTSGQWGMDDPGKGTNDTNLVEDYIKLPAEASGKKAWVAFLKERYGTIEQLNDQWAAEYEDFEDLLWIKEYRTVESVYLTDKLEFLKIIAVTYFRTTTEILRLYDKNHLILGCRLVGTSTPEVVLEAMARYIDVMSINFYSFDLPKPWLDRAYEITGKPMMVTEFSFSAGRSAGFDLITNGAQLTLVSDQKRRGESYHEFVTQAARLPYMVGTHWFALYDFWDRSGLMGNYGLYDKEDRLWPEFAEVVKATHQIILPEGQIGR